MLAGTVQERSVNYPAPPNTVYPAIDFETFSPAGFVWDPARGKWSAPKGATRKGISAVGVAVYTEHPGAEVLSCSYDLLDGRGVRFWKPGMPSPRDLFDHLDGGGNLEAHNLMFEFMTWMNICVPKYGWPSLEPYRAQLRCSMARCHVSGLPGALEKVGDALSLPVQKDKEGRRLLNKFSIPRDPTKRDARWRILPEEDPEDAARLYSYNATDVKTEKAVAGAVPDFSPAELRFWQLDQEMNWRGIAIDRKGVRDCAAVLDQAVERYGAECEAITGGIKPTQIQQLRGWLAGRGWSLGSLDAEAVDEALKWDLDPLSRRVLEIRSLVGSASVKKLYAIDNMAARDDRLKDLLVHHGARTGRPTAHGPQPLNLPKDGPALVTCSEGCGKPFAPHHDACPWCGAAREPGAKGRWEPATMVDPVLEVMASRSLALVEWYFGDAVQAIKGCIRSLFVAGPGHVFMASDYSAIEAVVIAELAGEEWRQQAFREGKPIYLLSAAKITGRTLEEYEAYREQHGEHHPDRQKIGKVAELGLGFGGWLGAWRQFDNSDAFTDEEVKGHILAWRAASPAIVEFWGGQKRENPYGSGERWRVEYFGVEGAAVQAIKFPGLVFDCKGIKFFMRDGNLIVRLLSGRELTYRSPWLAPKTGPWDAPWEMDIFYMTWNTNPKYGPMGWVPMKTYGGRLTENIVQATAHCILRHAIENLWAAGYRTVLHVYDEVVVEVPEGFGSLEELEAIMGQMPPWAAGWPVRAAGGWVGKRYRKD